MRLTFIHSFILDAFHVPHSVIGTVDTTVNKNDKNPCLHAVYIMWQVTYNKINNEITWYVSSDKLYGEK